MKEKSSNQTEVDRIEPLVADICARGMASYQDALDFFSFIEAPSHLRGINEVCKNLQSILPLVESIITFEHDPDQALLRKIPIWQSLAEEISEDCSTDFGRVSLLGDYSGEHALYVALFHRPKNQLLESRYNLLMSHVCYSAHILRKIKIKDKDYGCSRKYALRRVRQLTIAKNEQALSEFPSKRSSLSDYFESLDKKQNDFQNRVWKLFDYAVLKKPAVTHVGVSRIRKSHEKPPLISGEPVCFIEEDEYGRPVVEVVQLVQLPEVGKLEEIAKTLASPLEFATGRNVVQFDSLTEQLPTPRQDVQSARKMAKRIALDNQMLSLRWRVLTKYEVARFLEAVDKLSKKSTDQLSNGLPPLELAALLTCMFWTSSSPETASNFKLYRREPSKRQGKGYLVSKKEGHSSSWVVNPPRPIGYEQAKKPSFQAESAEDIVFLSVPEPARLIIERYLVDCEPEKKDEMFTNKYKVYLKAVKNFLVRLKRGMRMRHNEYRISDYLFERILHQPGSDIVTAMLATGRSHFLGWVSLHYTSVSIRDLQRHYNAVCCDVIENTTAELGLYSQDKSSRTRSDIKQKNSTRAGTRYCPRTKLVRILIKELKQLLIDAKKLSTTVKDVLTHHNRMVVYTTVMVGFATGYRAVSDPFLRQSFIDPVTGFAVISDKDTLDCYHSRIIWVPPMVMEQLDLYHKHLEAFGRRLMVINRKLYFEIRERLIEASSRPMLFMLKRNLKSLTVSKGSLEEICGKHLDFELPANANRHYLRTRLLRRKCPHDVIAAFMGHWEYGTEPWGRFSTLSPQAYRENLEHFLLPVLKKDGWKAVAGFGGNGE